MTFKKLATAYFNETQYHFGRALLNLGSTQNVPLRIVPNTDTSSTVGHVMKYPGIVVAHGLYADAIVGNLDATMSAEVRLGSTGIANLAINLITTNDYYFAKINDNQATTFNAGDILNTYIKYAHGTGIALSRITAIQFITVRYFLP